MNRPLAHCPSCGAPVEFRWSGAVQTVCPRCGSILVRHDLELERVGVVAGRLPDVSPVQVGVRGIYHGRGFAVTGRIAYQWERGAWNEWHLLFDDGASGWLSDAQAEYAVTFVAAPERALPPAESLQVGARFAWDGVEYRVTAITRARYAGVEGDLPFAYWGREEVPFADLRTEDGRFATIDYSESPPLLFRGETVDFGDLRLTGLRDRAQGPEVRARTLRCSNCGGPVALRTGEQAVNVACEYCGSILDARDPDLAVLQRFRRRAEVEPEIPLGSRGSWHGAEHDVVGFQVRTIRVEGVAYNWREYLLFNPERGFRYLTHYQGHWNDVIPVKSVPREERRADRPVAVLLGETFKHFQTATAETTFALGEFPWEVRVGDRAEVRDFVAPPRILSAESAGSEVTWSLGEYADPGRIWRAFGLPGAPPRRSGVFANQPSPHSAGAGAAWTTFGVLLALFLGMVIFRVVAAPPQRVLVEEHRFNPALGGDSVVVTEPFTLGGRTSSVRVEVEAEVENSWADFGFALLNQETGRVLEFGAQVSRYAGVEDGERWTEGSRREAVRLPSVPPGRYVLRVAAAAPAPVSYRVRVRRDLPALSLYFIALLLLVAPPVFLSLRAASFESSRWAESDYAPGED